MALSERGAEDNLSLREKSLLKRRVNKEHNSNFRAGYIHINEDSLHKTGLRGRKRVLLFCVLALLFIGVAFNVTLTVGILYFMKINHIGMTSLEFILPDHNLRFLDDVFMESGSVLQGFLGGRGMRDIDMEGQKVVLNSTGGDSSLSVGMAGVAMETDDFVVIDRLTGKLIFSTRTGSPVKTMVMKNLHAKSVLANKVVPREGVEDLHLHSFHDLEITGNEGVIIDAGGKVDFASRLDIVINSMSGDIELEGADGIYIAEHLTKSMDKNQTSEMAYKLCVCMPMGKVFLLPMVEPDLFCDNIDDSLCEIF
ncbi:hypothetical protein ScPMuIL_010014 [Solemya velum]